jgi:hypothetical protein
VRLELPEGYRPVPLDADPVARLARTERMVRHLFPGADADIQAAAVQHFLGAADLQRGSGVSAAAMRYGRVGDGFSAAYVSYLLTPLDYESVEVAAMGIFESYAGPDPDDADPEEGPVIFRDGKHVMGLTLPCGPAVALTELRTVQVAAASQDVGVLQVHVPVKEFQCLFVLTLMTPVLAEFGERCLDGAAMAMSLEFSDPDDGGDIGWRPRGLIGTGAIAPSRRSGLAGFGAGALGAGVLAGDRR